MNDPKSWKNTPKSQSYATMKVVSATSTKPNGKMCLFLDEAYELVGGPYYSRPKSLPGIKMAKEIVLPCDVDVPTVDFDVPPIHTLKGGIVSTLMLLKRHKTVYIGCMGGIGRTGLMMAALTKVAYEYERRGLRKLAFWDHCVDEPVAYVRKHYMAHAVETKAQQKYIADLEVSDLVDWYIAYARLTH